MVWYGTVWYGMGHRESGVEQFPPLQGLVLGEGEGGVRREVPHRHRLGGRALG